ncbi:DUF3054 domain-containing protein [Natrinema sp. 1APR25-10V2]|uniref:DUF3054 domain-containing protein n=1 Tax=Natrinema sp. 1APR25-10V2 TaxID=2951081 RepID=UPI00287448D6|nr:DUF3054 domain-containing protein [Natrinema sp. 1APR25-10V2]MDS0478004.1 DUF3054 domain-containing protein [Natrinema sp. 1APR25-10V2]
MDTAVRTGTRDGSVDRERLATATVDTVLVVGLVLLGNVEHGGNPIADPLASLETVAPFAIGWAAVSLLAGLYTRDGLEPVRDYRLLAITWIAAANVGLMLRASSLFEGGATWPFPLVITGFGLLALLGWRVGYALFRSATT